jgi:hypothetical protein
MMCEGFGGPPTTSNNDSDDTESTPPAGLVTAKPAVRLCGCKVPQTWTVPGRLLFFVSGLVIMMVVMRLLFVDHDTGPPTSDVMGPCTAMIDQSYTGPCIGAAMSSSPNEPLIQVRMCPVERATA